MWLKRTYIVCICLLVLSCIIHVPNPHNAEGAVIEVGPDMDHETISAAIEEANDGDTVIVYEGTYRENVVIDKSIEIRGVEGNDVIVDGEGGKGIFLTAKDVHLSGLNITNSSTGIVVYESSGVNMQNISIDDVDEGVLIWDSQYGHISNLTVFGSASNGIRVVNSTDQYIFNSTVIQHGYHSAYISRSSNINFDGCDFTRGKRGTYIYHSTYVTLHNNHISKGLNIAGESRDEFDTHSIGNNTVDDGEMTYLKDTSKVNIYDLSGQLILVNVTGSTVFNVSSSGLDVGILLAYSRDNKIIGNGIKDNFQGMIFHDSFDNHIHHNNFINNTRQIYSHDSSSEYNIWSDSLSGGNYWSDYLGSDTDEDLIGDTEIPHPLDDRGGGYFRLDPEPLMHMTSSMNLSISLQSGWNFISIGSVLPHKNLPEILQSIYGSYERAISWNANSHNWVSYIPGRAEHFNTFTYIERGKGFWIYMVEPANLTYHSVTPARTTITLYDGWNMIGIPSKGILSGESIPEEATMVGRFNESREYLVEYFNTTEIDYEPNIGYWLKLETQEPITWNIVWDET